MAPRDNPRGNSVLQHLQPTLQVTSNKST